MKAAERAAAKLAGESFYFTGKLCKNGHLAKRHTSHGACVTCRSMKIKVWRQNDYTRHKTAYIKRAKKWAGENNKKRREIVTRWRENHIEQVKAFALAIYKKHGDRWRVYCRNRRARIKGSVGQHCVNDIEKLLKGQRGKCYWCKKTLPQKYHVDHIFPLALGGSNDLGNLCVACVLCNRKKHTKLPEDFAGRWF